MTENKKCFLTNLTWTQGRSLSSITKGDQTYSYEYDMSGVRSVKIAEGLKHEYVTQNGRVVRDYVTDASTGAYVRCLDFTYDESGHPLTMRRYYNESQTSYNTYHYVLNGQGDVVKLLHGPNKTVAEYTYDAWGNLLSVSPAQSDDPTIAAQNPLRYRGYYYDTETGFYYLQSRYYDPIVRRFINADSYGSTGTGLLGYNMFAYCENNPVNCSDYSGYKCIVGDRKDYGNGCVAQADGGTSGSHAIIYDVPLYHQGGSNLCWAFCEVMDIAYRNNMVLTNNQATFVAALLAMQYHKSFIESKWNNGGWPLNCGERIEINSIYDLYHALKENGGPVYARYVESETSGHLVLVTGVNCTDDLVYTNNPWGTFGFQSFSGFTSGLAKGGFTITSYRFDCVFLMNDR